MKSVTYVASGYKYGLLCCPDESTPIKKMVIESTGYTNLNKPETRDVECSQNVDLSTIVPFEMVDGLSLEELKDYPNLLFQGKYLVFVMYDSLPITEWNPELDGFEKPKEQGVVRLLYAIDTEKNQQHMIDEVLEVHFVSILEQLNVQNRRRTLSFLEKYVCDARSGVYHTINNYLNINAGKEGSNRRFAYEYMRIPDRLIYKK